MNNTFSFEKEVDNILFNDINFEIKDSFSLLIGKENNNNIYKIEEEEIQQLFFVSNKNNQSAGGDKKIKCNNKESSGKCLDLTEDNNVANKTKKGIVNDSKKWFTNLNKYNESLNYSYRKDAYYKFFKVNLGRYIKNRINILKNRCFPYYSKNNFSTPNYKYTGNPKEKDNYIFLSFTIKELLIYGKDKEKYNRQYNNELLISFIEDNESRATNKKIYKELINFLYEKLEDVIIQFYDDEEEYRRITNDTKYIYFDKLYKLEIGVSLLEKYGYIKALKSQNKTNE